MVKHATLSTLSPVCWEARLTGADSQTFWIAARLHARVCVCLTILNVTTGTTNGARKTRRARCSPGVAGIHTSKAGEARPNRSCSAVTFTPLRSFQPTEVTEKKLEFFFPPRKLQFWALALKGSRGATERFHIQTVSPSRPLQTSRRCCHFICFIHLTSPPLSFGS